MKVGEKICPAGHRIDASWDLCPFCPPEVSTGQIPVVRPRGAGPTTQQGASGVARRSQPATTPATEPPSRTVAVPKGAFGLEPTRAGLVVGWLVGISSPIRGDAFAIRVGKNTIGRDPSSDVPVADDQTSSHHADLVYRPEEQRFILMDHNSTNGTYVNDAEIEPRCDLEHHDIIRVGTQRLVFIRLDLSWTDPRFAP
jgi:hypothetical protein